MKAPQIGRFPGRDYVALLLAFSLFLVVFGASFALVYATVVNEERVVSDSATQLLTALFGGIIAILGAYVGAESRNGQPHDDDRDADDHDAGDR